MNRKLPLIVITTLASIAACADDREPELPIIAGVYDETVDFDDYETFDVVEPDEVPANQNQPSSLLEADRIAVVQAIIAEMEARGYERDRESPDLELTTFIRYEDVEILTETSAWNNYYYGYYWGYSYPWYEREIIDLDAGTLIIDAVAVGDAADEDDDVLVFRGTAIALLPQPTGISGRIRSVVAEIFEFWPED